MSQQLQPLRVGLVGAGTIAHLAHLPTLSVAPGVTIAGLVTDDPAQTAGVCTQWPIERGYPSVDAMIDAANLDALFVMTPKQAHADPVSAGLRAGLDVFCEKPLASTSAEAARLVQVASEAPDAILMVGFNRRYAEIYRRAREALRPPDLQFVVAQKNRVGSEYRATLENGIHLLDLLRWFCGEAIAVHAYSHAANPYREDGVGALIRFDSGAVALVAMLRCAGEWDERMELYGGGRTVRVVATDQVTVITDGASSTWDMRARANGWNDVKVAAGFSPAVDHFLDCVRTRSAPLTSAIEALRSQQLMDQVLQAAGLPTDDDEMHGASIAAPATRKDVSR